MKNQKQYIKNMLYITVLSVNVPAYAIQNTTANILTVTTAALSAAGSYHAWDMAQGKIHPAVFGTVSCVFVSGVYYFLHMSTPEGRLKRANKLLDELARHTLVRNAFDTEKSFFDAVYDVYLTDDLPLISSYNHLIELLPTVHYAFGLISKASAEVGRNSLLQEECDSVSSRAKQLFTNMSDAIKRVREHKDYLAQLKIYKEFLMNEKQAVAQENMAHAQSQMAHAQQSSTFLKWLKAIFWGR